MTGEALGVEIEGTRLVVRGTLGSETVAVLDRALAGLEGPLTIDLTGVGFIDSHAIAVFVRAMTPTRTIQIVACSPQVLQVLQLTDTLSLLTGRHTARGVVSRFA